MTPQEAIDTIKTAIAEVEWNYPMDYAAAFDMAIDALKKDIPVIPGIGGNNRSAGGTWWYICPVCKTSVDKTDLYCRHCGRAMKNETV